MNPSITCFILQLHIHGGIHRRPPVSLTKSALLADVVVVNTPASEVALVGNWKINVFQVKTSEDSYCFPRVSYPTSFRHASRQASLEVVFRTVVFCPLIIFLGTRSKLKGRSQTLSEVMEILIME